VPPGAEPLAHPAPLEGAPPDDGRSAADPVVVFLHFLGPAVRDDAPDDELPDLLHPRRADLLERELIKPRRTVQYRNRRSKGH